MHSEILERKERSDTGWSKKPKMGFFRMRIELAHLNAVGTWPFLIELLMTVIMKFSEMVCRIVEWIGSSEHLVGLQDEMSCRL